MVAGPRFRVLVWNLNGNPTALEVAVEYLGVADEPALALLTEVPDRLGLGLGGTKREVSKTDL